MDDPFSLSDVSDLPEDIRPRKRGAKPGASHYERLVNLANRPVSVAEVRVAHYRINGIKASSASVSIALCRLAGSGRIVRIRHGIYAPLAISRPIAA